MTEQSRPWDITIKIAVEAADEAGALTLVDQVITAMDIMAAGPRRSPSSTTGPW